jgi:hypothetical protein
VEAAALWGGFKISACECASDQAATFVHQEYLRYCHDIEICAQAQLWRPSFCCIVATNCKHISRLRQFLLLTDPFLSSATVAMNVIGKLKEQHRRARRENESLKKLSVIPDSRIKGIGGLPIELWSLVIEFMVTDQLGDPRLPCWELPGVLDSRLVCRKCYTSMSRKEGLTINQEFLTGRSSTRCISASDSPRSLTLP